MHWENENRKSLLLSEVEDDRDNGLDDDEDNDGQSSISSENSCCEVITLQSSPSPQKAHIAPSVGTKVWHSLPDIDESILKALPNAEQVLDDLIAEQWDSESLTPDHPTCAQSKFDIFRYLFECVQCEYGTLALDRHGPTTIRRSPFGQYLRKRECH